MHKTIRWLKSRINTGSQGGGGFGGGVGIATVEVVKKRIKVDIFI